MFNTVRFGDSRSCIAGEINALTPAMGSVAGAAEEVSREESELINSRHDIVTKAGRRLEWAPKSPLSELVGTCNGRG